MNDVNIQGHRVFSQLGVLDKLCSESKLSPQRFASSTVASPLQLRFKLTKKEK